VRIHNVTDRHFSTHFFWRSWWVVTLWCFNAFVLVLWSPKKSIFYYTLPVWGFYPQILETFHVNQCMATKHRVFAGCGALAVVVGHITFFLPQGASCQFQHILCIARWQFITAYGIVFWLKPCGKIHELWNIMLLLLGWIILFSVLAELTGFSVSRRCCRAVS
jgi:hypothetical protein